MTIHHFDAKGMKCPLPVLKARKLMKDLGNGDVLEVHATDPGAPGGAAVGDAGIRDQAGSDAAYYRRCLF